MTSHEFTVIASGLNPANSGYEDRLFSAGCDDATTSIINGHLILDFTREAKSREDAVSSAIRDVKTTGAHISGITYRPS